jgi:branched-chain amino acid transport system substrate-binding protein
VKIGSIFNIGTAVGNFDEDQGALQAAVRAVNAAGGIDGKEVQLDICNENADPNQARACARKLISDKVIATVGNQVVTAEADVIKILAAAGIPSVAPVSFSGAALSDPNSYLLAPYGDFTNAAEAYLSAKFGGKRVAQILLDSPLTANYTPVVQAVTNASGGTFVGTVKVSITTSDPSTQAAALVALNPDTVILNGPPPVDHALVSDMASLGYTGKFMSPGTEFYESDLKALGSVADQVITSMSYPPLTATSIRGIKDFLADMAADKAAGDSKAPTETGEVRFSVINNWLGVKALAEITNAAHADTAATVKAALNSATNVNLYGLMAPWTPNKSLGDVKGARASQTSFWAYGESNGKPVLLTKTPVDMRDLVNKYGVAP